MYSTIVKKGLWQDIKEQEKAVRNPYYKTGFGAQFIGDEGKIKCYPGTEAKVEINKVTAVSGGVSLEPADFEVVTPTVTLTANEIRIKLSASGIEKVRKATAGEVSEYTFTFLFTRISDNKTATSDGKLKVANIDIINQTDIETTMKKVKGLDSGDLEGNLVITDENNNKCLFLLSGFTLDKNTAYESTASGVTNPVSADKAKSNIFYKLIKMVNMDFILILIVLLIL